jgi:hypothetical protein
MAANPCYRDEKWTYQKYYHDNYKPMFNTRMGTTMKMGIWPPYKFLDVKSISELKTKWGFSLLGAYWDQIDPGPDNPQIIDRNVWHNKDIMLSMSDIGTANDEKWAKDLEQMNRLVSESGPFFGVSVDEPFDASDENHKRQNNWDARKDRFKAMVHSWNMPIYIGAYYVTGANYFTPLTDYADAFYYTRYIAGAFQGDQTGDWLRLFYEYGPAGIIKKKVVTAYIQTACPYNKDLYIGSECDIEYLDRYLAAASQFFGDQVWFYAQGDDFITELFEEISRFLWDLSQMGPIGIDALLGHLQTDDRQQLHKWIYSLYVKSGVIRSIELKDSYHAGRLSDFLIGCTDRFNPTLDERTYAYDILKTFFCRRLKIIGDTGVQRQWLVQDSCYDVMQKKQFYHCTLDPDCKKCWGATGEPIGPWMLNGELEYNTRLGTCVGSKESFRMNTFDCSMQNTQKRFKGGDDEQDHSQDPESASMR